MRTVHWLFLVSVALFISGIGFVIAAARSTRDAAPVEAAPVTRPVASVRQIMTAIVGPSAQVVYEAVSTTVSMAGTEVKVPRNDEEWAVVAASAAALIESANLLMMGDRVVDRGDWIKMSQAMIEASMQALTAAEAKDPDALLDAGAGVNDSCDMCHERYQRQ